jgi:PAS domain S-box-containing protein
VLCAALIAASSILALRSVRASSEALVNTYSRDLILTQQLQYNLERKMSAARGLLLSTDPGIYRQRLQSATKDAEATMAALRKEIESTPGQQMLDAIERAKKEHQDNIDDLIRMRQSGASPDRVLRQWERTAAVRRVELEAATRALIERKEMLLEQAQTQASVESARLVRLIIGMTVVSLLLALTLAFLMSRTLVQMFNSEAAARSAAEEARQWFATTLASIGDGVIATDNQGNVTFTNEIAERLTGWNAADAQGRPIGEVFAVVHEKTREPVPNPVEQVLKTGVAVTLANHTVLLGRDGMERPIDDSAAPIRDTQRGVLGVVLVFRDVSARRRAEARIRESSEWLSTTMRSIGDAVIATNAEGRIILMNPVAQHLTGWNEQEAVGAPLDAVFRIINEQTRKAVESPAQKVLRTGSIVGLANHTILVARDGTEWPLDDSGAPIRDADGKIIGVVLVFREITERRRAHEALRQESEQRRLALDAAQLGTWDYRFDIGEVFWDERCRDLFGIAQGEKIGYDSALSCIHADDRAAVDQAVNQALTGVDGGVYHRVFRVVWPNGSVRWVDSHGQVHFAGGGHQGRPLRFVGVSMEITERRRAEEALVRSEKLASAARMAATMAHEINNPLEAITNALFLVACDNNLPPETRAHLQIAEQELQRVAHITKQTLGFYRESSSPTNVAVQEVVENVLALYERKLRQKNIQVQTKYRPQDGHVIANVGEIRQVVSNLVANAIDALPQHGVLHLRVTCCPAASGGRLVRVTVADTGSGIDMPHLRSIFEPFFTTKDVVGTGLGLWVTREIVRKYRGNIRIRTRPGKGTVFCIYLPAAQPSHSMAAAS